MASLKRIFTRRPTVARIAAYSGGVGLGVGVSAGVAWLLYTRHTQWVPYDETTPDLRSPAARLVNPYGNPSAGIDCAVRVVPLSKLQTTDAEELALRFVRGVLAGSGFAFQRWMLARRFKALPGRRNMLWDLHEIGTSDYEFGTMVADHLEVVERTPGKVVFRMRDSPTIREPRFYDGLLIFEVKRDGKNATFAIKTICFDSRKDYAVGWKMPALIQFIHYQYVRLWMESSVRKLLK